MKTKTCATCGKRKSTTKFYKHRNGLNGLRSECIGCSNKRSKAYHILNKRKINAAQIKWYKVNRTRKQQQNKAWAEAHPARMLVIQKAADCNTRARRAGVVGTVTPDDITAIYRQQGSKCFYCPASLGLKYHIDHKIPLSRSGPNTVCNLCCACKSCSLDKGAQTAAEFIQERATC